MESKIKTCRHCKNELKYELINLGKTPPSNSFLKIDELEKGEIFYPLTTFVCEKCFLVQVPEYKSHSDIFNDDYAYFSSYSDSWLNHIEKYVENITDELNLSKDSFVLEIASNDGYLLKNFVNKSIPCLGVEPTQNTAKIAIESGIDTLIEFFSYNLSNELKKADLIICNNVLAHVPDINDFVKGLKNVLKPGGTITIEFPHLLNLLESFQFDTIYHEHFSYLSLFSTKKIFESFDLEIYKVDKILTHGGSLRLYVKNKSCNQIEIDPSVQEILDLEVSCGINNLEFYENFKIGALNIKLNALNFLIDTKIKKKSVLAYGAAAKGNTFLNYCGVGRDLIPYVVDKSEHKQGRFLPTNNIPILNETIISEIKPDYIIILPWNLEEEIKRQLSYVNKWGCKFVTFIPQLNISEG